MKILFTGPSSFTGYWFVKELAHAGHEITATFRNPKSHYSGTRKKRVDLLDPLCHAIFDCPYGSEAFLQVIEGTNFDLLCHHAADVTNYKSPDFDYVQALASNTHQMKRILQALIHKNCQGIVITGSVFEQGEGQSFATTSLDDLRAVSPYGLSKGLTSEVFKYFTSQFSLPLKKFVIPNPFGPLEEIRYTTFLMQTWFSNKVAEVKCPQYIRDNIHASLLAKAYRQFSEKPFGQIFEKYNPSGYIESQGEFTARFSLEMKKRLTIPCEYVLCEQTDFSEPLVRVNTSPLNAKDMLWSEEETWDELASYYKEMQHE